MTIREARAILDKNNKIARTNNLKVVTVFRKGQISKDITYTSMFSDSSYEVCYWADQEAEMLKKFNVPFLIYNNSQMRESFGYLDFDHIDE